ncbi:hypothetical protein [Kribbella sp. NPDC023855]|uniref:hypothetical protein n=1 Tax=Kribbella sp. NPDC023855 TaxID=3154698 RepID=UPI0033F12FBF
MTSWGLKRGGAIVVAAALVMAALTGCDDHDQAKAVAPNRLLLGADEVGDGASAVAVQQDDYASPTLCGPESDGIKAGVEPSDFAAFTRGGSRVVVGAWEKLDVRDSAISAVAKKATDPTCTEGAGSSGVERWRVRLNPGSDRTKVSFSWTRWWVQDGTAPLTPKVGDGVKATSGVRAYRLVGDYVVTASIIRESAQPPAASELAKIFDRQSIKVDTTPGTSGPDACGLLNTEQVSAALGTDPRSTLDDSTNKQLSTSNVLACRYLGQGEERLTFRGSRTTRWQEAQAEVAKQRQTCPTAVELDMSQMSIHPGTGFICPAAKDGGPATAWAQWMTVVLQVQLRPTGDPQPTDTTRRLTQVTTEVQRKLTFDAFGSRTGRP